MLNRDFESGQIIGAKPQEIETIEEEEKLSL